MFKEQKGYIVSRHTKEVNGQIEMSLFVKTPDGTVKVIPDRQQTSFFSTIPMSELPTDINGVQYHATELSSFEHQAVTLIQTNSMILHRQILKFVKQTGHAVFEEDIKPHDRYLMERNIRGAIRFIGMVEQGGSVYKQAKVIAGDYSPNWNIWSLDIETSVTHNKILSIGVTNDELRQAFVVAPENTDLEHVTAFADERSLLLGFMQFVKKHNPDVFIGWNLIGFDLHFIDQRCQQLGIRAAFGVNGETWSIRSSDNQGKYFASIPGRVALDGITLLKVGGYHFESYSLNNVSHEILGDSKLLHGGDRWQEIERMHQHDLAAFVDYNLQDCDLVWRIFKQLKLIELQQTRVDLTGIPMEQTGGSVASFENLYIPRLHQAGYVAPAWKDEAFVASPGGFVMNSIPGLYKNVLVFDFKSLYPSIIRTFFIDPLARISAQKRPLQPNQHIVPGYLGAHFDVGKAILPELVGELAKAREDAKSSHNDILSYAIKIIMNSLYGVLGSNVCRFYHAELASSITMRGHEILQLTKSWMEEKGATVIYGDTDSLFVVLNDDRDQAEVLGKQLCEDINHTLTAWCRNYANVDSHLELEFETLYERFFMPTIRGQEEGSKKRYAGKAKDKIIFKGLEAARTDWTKLAREFQRNLFDIIFNDENPIPYIQSIVEQLKAGKLDEWLVYSKQLSRPLSAYSKHKPPHVRAAMMIDEKRASLGLPLEYNKGRKRVNYVYQTSGVMPYETHVDLRHLDYEHYIEKQLVPIADSVLPIFKTNMASLLSQQISLL
ncbi:DNA polymerase II [Marinomonas aquiplantarum]|uniref:DNA polymerase n=1 Tax=Marinomonas aquiplantarum TaxID=491951 RepID=A0A366CYI5_9GAMM|nr:DNA polymerase II [Marinomonas aquiplantarum]RBO82873.1 DNA damage-inducible DNA polymerase II [Marinomonas aquiplantarum]